MATGAPSARTRSAARAPDPGPRVLLSPPAPILPSRALFPKPGCTAYILPLDPDAPVLDWYAQHSNGTIQGRRLASGERPNLVGAMRSSRAPSDRSSELERHVSAMNNGGTPQRVLREMDSTLLQPAYVKPQQTRGDHAVAVPGIGMVVFVDISEEPDTLEHARKAAESYEAAYGGAARKDHGVGGPCMQGGYAGRSDSNSRQYCNANLRGEEPHARFPAPWVVSNTKHMDDSGATEHVAALMGRAARAVAVYAPEVLAEAKEHEFTPPPGPDEEAGTRPLPDPQWPSAKAQTTAATGTTATDAGPLPYLRSHQVFVRYTRPGGSVKGSLSSLHFDKNDGRRRSGAPLVYVPHRLATGAAATAAAAAAEATATHSTMAAADLMVFESQTGGRAMRVRTCTEGFMAVVIFRSDSQLHCNVYPDAPGDLATWPTRGMVLLRIIPFSKKDCDGYVERVRTAVAEGAEVRLEG